MSLAEDFDFTISMGTDFEDGTYAIHFRKVSLTTQLNLLSCYNKECQREREEAGKIEYRSWFAQPDPGEIETASWLVDNSED